MRKFLTFLIISFIILTSAISYADNDTKGIDCFDQSFSVRRY